MPRAINKTELIAAATEQWTKLWQLIDSLPAETKFATFNFDNDPKLKEAHWYARSYCSR